MDELQDYMCHPNLFGFVKPDLPREAVLKKVRPLFRECKKNKESSAESSGGGVCSNVYVVFETFLDVTQ